MKRTLTALALTLMMTGSAFAKTPPEVLEPYKAYRAAIKAGDANAALSHAYDAWQAAEISLGDSQGTGDLAQNYADVRSEDKKTLKNQIKAMRRAQDLSSVYGENSADIFMQRGMKVYELELSAGNKNKAQRAADELIEYAESNNMERSTFYAEALTAKAGVASQRRYAKDTIKYADKALSVFANPSDEYASVYPIFAHLYKGFGHEYQDEVLEAALAYQTVMESIKGVDYNQHPLPARALGRWSHMRARLRVAGEYDAAKDKGLKDLYPYNVERNESVKPIERFPPKFSPRALRAGVSGYTIIEFDLDDDGNPISPNILVSWPPEFYERSSLQALNKWKYTPRASGETDKDRENLITTIRYQLSDSNGNPVY